MAKKKSTLPDDRPAWLTGRIFNRFGQVPDTLLAEEAGVHRSTIRRWRRRYRIAAWCPGRAGLFG